MNNLAPVQESCESREVHRVVLPNRKFPLNWRAANYQFQKRFLIAALAKHNGNKTHAARSLGITRRALQLQIRALDLE